MRLGPAKIRPSRAFFQLLALTACVSAVAGYLHGAVPKFVIAVVVAFIAVSKVRLVVFDFMGERQDRSPIRRALIVWAAAVLAIALVRAAIVGMSS